MVTTEGAELVGRAGFALTDAFALRRVTVLRATRRQIIVKMYSGAAFTLYVLRSVNRHDTDSNG